MCIVMEVRLWSLSRMVKFRMSLYVTARIGLHRTKVDVERRLSGINLAFKRQWLKRRAKRSHPKWRGGDVKFVKSGITKRRIVLFWQDLRMTRRWLRLFLWKRLWMLEEVQWRKWLWIKVTGGGTIDGTTVYHVTWGGTMEDDGQEGAIDEWWLSGA